MDHFTNIMYILTAFTIAIMCVSLGYVIGTHGRPHATKTHYSLCIENTYPKCVLGNKSLPSLGTYCKVATEEQCKGLRL